MKIEISRLKACKIFIFDFFFNIFSAKEIFQHIKYIQKHPLDFTVVTFIVAEKKIPKTYKFFGLLNHVSPWKKLELIPGKQSQL